MKIAQVAPLIESVPPKLYGGTERVVAYLTEELVAQGHDVTLFASGDSCTSARLIPGAPKALRLAGCKDPLPHHIAMLEDVYRRADDFDVIHYHIDYVHYPMSVRQRVPQVTTVHGRLDLPDLVPLYQTFPEVPLVSISQSQRAPMAAANWVATIHHGLPKDVLTYSPGPGSYLAFVGRLSPDKGPDRAIEIAKRCGLPLKIAAKIDPEHLDYYHDQLEPSFAHPLIEYVGEINEAQKNDFLGGALAMLFPISWPEPFGLAMIEAMACGTPVIAFPHGAVPEVMKEGVSGFVVEDVDGAVRAVNQVAGLSRAACRQHFDERFSAERMARDHVALYQRLIGQKMATHAKVRGLSVA